MKKLIACLKGKLEDKKIENKAKRVEIALSAAELNFKSQKDDNEIKLEECLDGFNNPDSSVEDLINIISKTMDKIDEAKEGLVKIKRVRDWLFEEVEG